jgi:HAMP domain-containing protein/signal transduction histidine kinase/CheY-like chemotaxis protein
MATRNGRSRSGKSAAVAESEAPAAAAITQDGEGARLDMRELLRVLSSLRRGDFSVRMAADATGVGGRIADTLNDILDMCERSAKEYERVSRAVGKDGRINQRVNLGTATGGWAVMAESMNSLIGDLVQPSTEIARVITAVAKGDLTQSMPLEVEGRSLKGEFLRSARVVNTMVEQLNSFASEVTRVAREVGTEGKLGGQAEVKGVAGTWKDLTESVNSMASNLTSQVRNIAQVTTAVARGDLTTKITVDARGEILELKNTINTMVDQLSSFAGEVTRVAREVGTEGKLGGQADVKGVAGVWKELTENVNLMAGNLTNQVRNIAQVTTAVANGDLSTKITVEARGEFLELKNTINVMVDQLNAFAGEVTRVAREVGTEGKLGGQAEVKGVGGVWKDLTDSVNFMAGNLTAQVRNIADVTTAVANGDLSKKITVDVRGEILELKNTINTMVDQLNAFAGEVTRVAREVGTEGKLGGQAEVKGVGGVWKDLTDNVNSMARNLTNQVRNIAEVTTAVARGDLSTKITVDARGEILELKNTINTMVDQLNAFAGEVTRVAREVGTEGKLGGQADVRGIGGVWKDLTDSVNSMAGNLTNQVRNIAHVTTAVANGDLSRKITVDARGEILALKDTINTMVDQLNAFASEVTRVAREVGTDGKLGGQAIVKGVAGTWKDLTDSVNFMASNLTNQVRNIAQVTTAVARGDLSTKITVDARGEILELKNTINTMVDQLNAFASEVTRVAREVGTEGALGGQAVVKDVAGTWKDLTDNVNSMASNLTNQVRNIAEVTTAVANGDLSKKITVDARGEILELKNTINTMVDQLNAFASEVTRVAREVGTEGKLGGQADVKGVAGTWKDLTDSVNRMAGNLTAQVRNIAEVTTAVARGDLSKKITVDVRGEILELKNTINTMVDQLNAFAGEVTRVAREVGTEGKLGGQADVRGVAGTWKDLTDSVNSMASNLTAQVRNIADVTTAVARGDLSKKITVDVRGEILELKNTINTMVDQLNAFAGEVTRVAREVGTEGKLGGQVDVRGLGGVWKDLTDSVNSLASNLTTQVRNIAQVTTAVANGDLSRKITVDVRGEILELKNTINTMVDQLSAFASEVTRVAREVGTEGKLGGQADVPGVGGVWKDLTDNVNSMASNLTNQVRNIAQVTTAVAMGDLSRKITVDVRGEILELKNTINTMVDQLNAFAGEVTRVAREVGAEGKLGGQAEVRGIAGTWKDLTDNVNSMAANLTTQVRGIAKVVTAVANGDLKRKLVLETKGEIAELADTINNMIDTLATFADQVTTVAREVGVEGKLGGQARVPGAAGIWRDLTNNVNQLAANLTTQVRAIAEVATAVTKGDLTRSIAVEAQGELAALKDNINEMILNLRETTQRNTEQDWLKTNVARFTGMLQGQRDLLTVARRVLSELAPLVNAQHGVFYMNEATDGGEPLLKLIASYAYKDRKGLSHQFRAGEGLVGQCALEKQRIRITDVPPDYIRISSGLGEASPLDIVVLPVLFEGEVKAVIELASFKNFSDVHIAFLEQLTENMGIVLNTIQATMRTEELLKQSQALAEELQSQQKELREGNKRLEEQARTLQKSEELLKKQQDELQRANLELQEKARLLVEQNEEVERKNREVEQARKALEEKAEQLALTSRYKSEFLANMSHELRTPLNSLLILAQMLAENAEGKLTPKQVKFAQTIHQSGVELLSLINDILDLSKIESGMMGVELEQVFLTDVHDQAVRTFRHVAEEKGLELKTEIAPGAPKTIYTDPRRLQQIIKNLLSNAVKFTDHGSVTLKVERAASGWSGGHPVLDNADSVIAFHVMDTGIGIPEDQQHVIFEPFRQADSGANRQYGGTGLGLSISRELAHLLGGEIRVQSQVGEGSTFTLYLPANYVRPPQNGRAQFRTELQPPAIRSEGQRPQTMSQAAASAMAAAEPPVTAAALQPIDVPDDRESIQPGDEVLLIVEDDPTFARILIDLAHERKLKVVVAPNGAKGLLLARELAPGAISLDIRLPDMAGWTIIDRLKHDPATRHIPIHVISIDEDRRRGLSLGAASYMEKGIDMRGLVEVFDKIKQSIEFPERNLLVVEGDEDRRRRLAELIEAGDVHTTFLASGEEALNALHNTRFDCIVVDLKLADMSGIEFVKRLQQQREGKEMPVLVYTGESPAPEVEDAIKRLAQTGLVRGVRSAEKLLEDTAIFLHRVEAALPEEKRRLLEQARGKKESAIAGGKVLLVDDDVRNLFALTSVLERHKLRVLHAESGQEAIDLIKSEPDIDLVLMDIMMPKMDGYETIRRIRQMPGAHNLPIVALTAKAMKGDREKCIEAGASDYITKPVNLDDLIWMLRAWLPRVSEGA